MHRRLTRDILGVGAVSALGGLQLNLAVVLVTGAVGKFGVEALAGYGIASRLDYLMIPLLFGLGSAVLTMVGACIGAGNLARARRVTWIGIAAAAVFAGIVGLVVAIHPLLWLGLFSRDPAVIDTGGLYLRVVGPTYAFTAAVFVYNFAAQGAGRPLWPFLAGSLRLLIAAALGWVAVFTFDASLQALSLLVATGSVGAALVCFAADAAHTMWPRIPIAPVKAPAVSEQA